MEEKQNLIQITPKMFTSRTAVLTYKTCHYKRLLAFHAQGSGLVPEKENLDLLNGSVVHRGLQHLLEHCRKHRPDEELTEACIDEAVEKAGELWTKQLTNHGLQLKTSAEYDRLEWILAEQETLWEGLIRAWASYKLPGILEEYEILEVEHEEVFEDFSETVTFLGKADGLFRRKSDNKLVILSIKTTSEYADVTTRDILHDMQGVSEWICVRDRIDKIWGKLQDGAIREDMLWLTKFESKPEIFAVQYEYLVKGARKEDPYKSGEYRQQSFLVHPQRLEQLMRVNMMGGGGSIIDPAEYKWKWGAGKPPKGWSKCDIWDEMSIKNWIEMLATGQVQPEEGNPFEKILPYTDLVIRDEREMEEWLVSTRFQEEKIASALKSIEMAEYYGDIELAQKIIWQEFDKNTLSCHNYFNRDCQFVAHCHDNCQTLDELKDAGYLIPRTPHHELEKEEHIKKGFIEDE